MSALMSDCQFAWFSRWNRFRANEVASASQGEGEGEGLFQASRTSHLSPLPSDKGRGEKGRRVSFSFWILIFKERSSS
jgi:hypothetical protein